MNREWFKNVGVAMMLTLALGTAACGSSQGGDDSEDVENFVNEQNTRSDDEGSVQFFDGGSITDTGDGLSASFNDGTGISFDD